MKRNLLTPFLLLFIFKATTGLSAQYTITAPGYVFSPDSISVNLGDTIVFSLSSIHSAVEVDQSTWNANGDNSNGGFQVPLGGGTIVVSEAKTYYYVCGLHYYMGMKGRIFVSSATGTSLGAQLKPTLEIAPNPSSGLVSVKSNLSATKENRMTISDFTGKKVVEKENPSSMEYLDLSELKAGIYFVEINTIDAVVTKRLIISK